jgi:hypothetical protein
MKYILLSLFLSTLFIFTACEKSDELLDQTDKIDFRDGDLTDRGTCLELVFPVSFTMPDGSTITGETREALSNAIRRWYEAHPDAAKRHKMNYPVEAIFKGKPITLHNEAEMARVKKACSEKDDERPCIQLVFPLSYLMPDGTTITGDDKETVNRAIKAWYADHPDVREKPALQYPVDILFKGNLITLENEEGMIRAKKECAKENDREPCFKLVYPVSYILPDGSSVTGNNRKEVGIAIKEWYVVHPDVREKPVLHYPVNVILGDRTITIQNEEEMIRLKKGCN